ncbi:MAG: hypothetical protein GX803_05650 [Lentisphaerae bacterium]|jgi:hypothetical protein|nr:hypothetical protein [Lentisphaerota bacterium]
MNSGEKPQKTARKSAKQPGNEQNELKKAKKSQKNAKNGPQQIPGVFILGALHGHFWTILCDLPWIIYVANPARMQGGRGEAVCTYREPRIMPQTGWNRRAEGQQGQN